MTLTIRRSLLASALLLGAVAPVLAQGSATSNTPAAPAARPAVTAPATTTPAPRPNGTSAVTTPAAPTTAARPAAPAQGTGSTTAPATTQGGGAMPRAN